MTNSITLMERVLPRPEANQHLISNTQKFLTKAREKEEAQRSKKAGKKELPLVCSGPEDLNPEFVQEFEKSLSEVVAYLK